MKKEYWLMGNGINISFAPPEQKNWLKWITFFLNDEEQLSDFFDNKELN